MIKLNFFSLTLFFFVISIILKSFSDEKTKNTLLYDFTGKVNVTDGDTIKNGNIKIRLHGIDAPEIKQTCQTKTKKSYPCGYRSYIHLKSLIKNKTVYCQNKTKDRYGRFVSECFTKDLNLNSTMVKDGWAIAYRYFSEDYIPEEEIAKRSKKGIWQGTFIEPYVWRKKNK